jgi:hypothetical protein
MRLPPLGQPDAQRVVASARNDETMFIAAFIEPSAGQAIAAWREMNAAIVVFWNALYEAMRDAVEVPVGYEREV